MTVKELSEACGFKVAAMPIPEKEVSGAYIGDLLSWVMGRANAGNVWVTIMSNVNVLAVASLSDASCVVLAEGVTLTEDILETANKKGINILYSDENAYQTAEKLFGKV